jgi:hypothetical protein
MPPTLRRLLIFLVLLVPSAQFAWRNRTMPQFAYLHDDGILFETAKSVSQGGFSIPSLPERPSQTKFPPLYPLYLSIAWRIQPEFPANLPVAELLSWLTLAACLWLAWRYYGQTGFRRGWIAVALLAFNPYMVLFGTSMFSEIFFTCLVMAALLALGREGLRWTVVAGLIGGLAYLARSAGIALLVSVPAWLLFRKQARRAAVFAVAMSPFVLGWMAWSRMHAIRTSDPTLLYYTDYFGYQFLNVGFDNFYIVLWKNLDQLLYGVGSLVLPKVTDSAPVKILTQVIAVAMIAGTVRLARRGIAEAYAWFALVSAGILLVWHFPPNERFVLPLYPLLAAGLVYELEILAVGLRKAFAHKDAGQRGAAWLMSFAVGIVFTAAAAIQIYVTFFYLQDQAAAKARKLADQRTAYQWIAANLPASATILSYDDPLLYLYTGRRGNYLPMLPRWWYGDDHASMIAAYRDIASYCRARGLDYVYFTTEDLEREMGDEDRAAIGESIRTNPALTPVFHAGIGTVYRVNGPRAIATAPGLASTPPN